MPLKDSFEFFLLVRDLYLCVIGTCVCCCLDASSTVSFEPVRQIVKIDDLGKRPDVSLGFIIGEIVCDLPEAALGVVQHLIDPDGQDVKRPTSLDSIQLASLYKVVLLFDSCLVRSVGIIDQAYHLGHSGICLFMSQPTRILTLL